MAYLAVIDKWIQYHFLIIGMTLIIRKAESMLVTNVEDSLGC